MEEITKPVKTIHDLDLDEWVITKIHKNGTFDVTRRCKSISDCPEGYACNKGIMKQKKKW